MSQAPTFDLQTLRHSVSHVMAAAVTRLYPNAKLAIGPAIDNGFYYDFDLDTHIKQEDLKAIEAEMKKIIKERHAFTAYTLPRAEALEAMADQPYKVELIHELPDDAEISFYKTGDFVDLCAGPHIDHAGRIKAFKLLNVTGAYWRGNSDNKMLQRIYGTAFATKDELAAHLHALEEAKKRDHNKIGRELGYFTTVDYIGQGLPILLPKGAKVLQLLQRFVEDEEEKRGYLLTKTPMMAKRDTYKISSHWQHYRDGMFVIGDADAEENNDVFALRPMTCPFQFQVYLNKMRSYRDLPIRLNETATLFRNEGSGEMHGLIRVRQFTLADGHIICTPEQVESEFVGCMELLEHIMDALGIRDDLTYRFSKWDPNNKEKYLGTAEDWENAQAILKATLDKMQLDYVEADGEAAFYGPKLDVQFKNVHGKEDTLLTIQLDFQLAERFGMDYVDADGQKKHPYVIHRSSLGCYERTLAMLLEKYAGALPLWTAPVQVKLLPLTDRHQDHCRRVANDLRASGLRVEIDERNEKIGYKIREAQLEKIPYMLIVGDKEQEENTVSVRARDGDKGAMPVAEFVAIAAKEIEEKS
ncbi:MAG: threonine--tRNA ligase [Oscillospiraceae bacterium]|nr:threonine--tRNA ligase [Oscillospiraceae bacterium]